MSRLLSHYQWTAIHDLRHAYETNFVEEESCSNLKRSDLTLSGLVNTSRFLVRRLINFAKTLADFSQLKQVFVGCEIIPSQYLFIYSFLFIVFKDLLINTHHHRCCLVYFEISTILNGNVFRIWGGCFSSLLAAERLVRRRTDCWKYEGFSLNVNSCFKLIPSTFLSNSFDLRLGWSSAPNLLTMIRNSYEEKHGYLISVILFK